MKDKLAFCTKEENLSSVSLLPSTETTDTSTTLPMLKNMGSDALWCFAVLILFLSTCSGASNPEKLLPQATLEGGTTNPTPLPPSPPGPDLGGPPGGIPPLVGSITPTTTNPPSQPAPADTPPFDPTGPPAMNPPSSTGPADTPPLNPPGPSTMNPPFSNGPGNTSPPGNPTSPSTMQPPSQPGLATPPGPTLNPPTSTPGSSSSGMQWCVASQTASPTALQTALDYACGYGGSDCSAIQPGGSCYNPNTVRDHASYAFNDFYQKHPGPNSCAFGGTAQLTSTDPSKGNCRFSSGSKASSTSTSPPSLQSPPTSQSPPFNSPPTTTPTSNMTPPTMSVPGSPSIYEGAGAPTDLPSSAVSLLCSFAVLSAATGLLIPILASNLPAT